jgi:hypothetical protein
MGTLRGPEALRVVEERNASKFEELRERLDELIGGYRYPEERRIGYGNLRQEYSNWHKGGSTTTNVAIVYETPGGSTAQINITYDDGDDRFSYLEHSRGVPVSTASVERVIGVVAAIPRKRRTVLFSQVETWCAEGKAVFEELNKLLQSEFLGGRINHVELREGINHAIECRKRAGYTPPDTR